MRFARTFAERTRGLLTTDESEAGVLVIERTRQVHTFGMRYPLDVIFCNAEWTVVHVVRHMRPGRVTRWVRRARIVIEIPSAARRMEVAPGDALRIDAS